MLNYQNRKRQKNPSRLHGSGKDLLKEQLREGMIQRGSVRRSGGGGDCRRRCLPGRHRVGLRGESNDRLHVDRVSVAAQIPAAAAMPMVATVVPWRGVVAAPVTGSQEGDRRSESSTATSTGVMTWPHRACVMPCRGCRCRPRRRCALEHVVRGTEAPLSVWVSPPT